MGANEVLLGDVAPPKFGDIAMSNRSEIFHQPLTSIYAQDEVSQPIDLGQVTIMFEWQGKSHCKAANVKMEFLPKHDIRFIIPLEDGNPCCDLNMVGQRISVALAERDVTRDFYCTAIGDRYGGIVFSPTRSGITVTQPSSTISKAIFHLFNFPDFWAPDDNSLGTTQSPVQREKKCRRVVMNADGWKITIAGTDQTYDLGKQLDAHGGYVITHLGEIVREDGTEFTSERLDDQLTCLHHFLSFTLGCWAGIALPVGFDRNGHRVFEQWGMRHSTAGSWGDFCSWFDRIHGELLSQAFPGFVSLWKNALWREPLARAVYWYVGACTGGFGNGVDTGIILAQTALELLAWTYCVQDRKIVSSEAFGRRNGLRASDKLRLLVSSLKIHKEIPPTLSALHGRRGRKWDDSMEAITSLRNSFVHPDVGPAVSAESYFDAYRLSVWYVALVLLRLCGHDGMYANMLAQDCSVGSVERVPWGVEQRKQGVG